MKTSRLLSAVALMIVCGTAQGLAVAFTVGGSSSSATYDTYWVGGTEPNPAVKFYKNDFSKSVAGGEEEGTYDDQFATSWGALDDEDEPFLATITWEDGFEFCLTQIWLKAGNGVWQAFDLTGFDSSLFDSIELYDTEQWWHEKSQSWKTSAISHIQLIGTECPPRVPDTTSTLALLGLGLGALGFVARRRKA